MTTRHNAFPVNFSFISLTKAACLAYSASYSSHGLPQNISFLILSFDDRYKNLKMVESCTCLHRLCKAGRGGLFGLAEYCPIAEPAKTNHRSGAHNRALAPVSCCAAKTISVTLHTEKSARIPLITVTKRNCTSAVRQTLH